MRMRHPMLRSRASRERHRWGQARLAQAQDYALREEVSLGQAIETLFGKERSG